MQTRTQSLIEAMLNTLSGFVLAIIVGQLVYPWFGFTPSLAQNFWLTVIFTFVSVARLYAWRRMFNWIHRGGAHGR